MQQYDPRESQFHTFHSPEEKLQPRRKYHPLTIILAVLSLLYAAFLFRLDGLLDGLKEGFILLSFIDILIVNIAFFYLLKVGKRRIENQKQGLFFCVAFLSAVILVYFAQGARPTGFVYFLGVWIIAILLNTVIYQYGAVK